MRGPHGTIANGTGYVPFSNGSSSIGINVVVVRDGYNQGLGWGSVVGNVGVAFATTIAA